MLALSTAAAPSGGGGGGVVEGAAPQHTARCIDDAECHQG